jgi:hypothetical protein
VRRVVAQLSFNRKRTNNRSALTLRHPIRPGLPEAHSGRDQTTLGSVTVPAGAVPGGVHDPDSSCSGDIVFYLFGGSGTTLIPCENSGRTAHRELDRSYYGVIVRRHYRNSRAEASSLAMKGNPTMLVWLGKQHLEQSDESHHADCC